MALRAGGNVAKVKECIIFTILDNIDIIIQCHIITFSVHCTTFWGAQNLSYM